MTTQFDSLQSIKHGYFSQLGLYSGIWNLRVAPSVQSMGFKKVEITSWHLAFSRAAMGLGGGSALCINKQFDRS